MTNVKKYARKTALAVAALIAITVGSARLYAYGQSVGRDQVTAIDAGPGPAAVTDAGPDVAAPTKVQVPAPSSSPGGLFEVTKDARKVGGLWLAIVVVLFAIAAEVRQRTKPGPDEPAPDPRSWRARSYALACGIAAIAATLVDIGFGGIGWSALAVPGAYAAGRVMDAFNPPKVGKAKE